MQTIKLVQTEKEVTDKLACDNCGADIPLVFEDIDEVHEQGLDALQLIFSGGYGMYVDPLVQRGLQMLWCKACADKLCVAFPSINERIGRTNPTE